MEQESSSAEEEGPFALRFVLRIPEPGYVYKTKEEGVDAGKEGYSDSASAYPLDPNFLNPDSTASSQKFSFIRSDHPHFKTFQDSTPEEQTSLQTAKRIKETTNDTAMLFPTFYRRKQMHHYSGQNLTLEIRVNRNWPFSPPRVAIMNSNVEHAFLGGSSTSQGGNAEKSSKLIPGVLFAKGGEGWVMDRELIRVGKKNNVFKLSPTYKPRYSHRRFSLKQTLLQSLCFFTYLEDTLVSVHPSLGLLRESI